MTASGIPCSGAPRDLGLDQGRALAAAVRREASRGRSVPAWLPERPDPRVRRVARDVARFFPHAAERAAGLARGAGVSRAALARLLARELGDGADAADAGSAGALLGATPERSGAGALLARGLDAPHGREPFAVRWSVPEHDHRSVELVLPWLVAPVAGVNDAGLAAAVAAAEPRAGDLAVCWAPAALLVQDCLQRFDRVERALDWCARRPAGGRASLLFADASGDLAALLVGGAQRRVERPAQGLVVGLGDAARREALAKACLDYARLDADALRETLAGRGVLLDASACALLVWDADGVRRFAAAGPPG